MNNEKHFIRKAPRLPGEDLTPTVKEELRKTIEQQIDDFFKRGGKITELAPCESTGNYLNDFGSINHEG